MWEIIEGTIEYTTGDVFKMYGVIAAISFAIVIFMFKNACNKDD